MNIEHEYNRLIDESGIQCPTITFWKTRMGDWGARAGVGESVFARTLKAAVREAVNDGIHEASRLQANDSTTTTHP